jgi:hypothetical protein
LLVVAVVGTVQLALQVVAEQVACLQVQQEQYRHKHTQSLLELVEQLA